MNSPFLNDDMFFKSTGLTDGGLLLKARKLPIGTIRSYKGMKYQKVAEGKWKPVSKEKKEVKKVTGQGIKKLSGLTTGEEDEAVAGAAEEKGKEMQNKKQDQKKDKLSSYFSKFIDKGKNGHNRIMDVVNAAELDSKKAKSILSRSSSDESKIRSLKKMFGELSERSTKRVLDII